MLIWKYNECNAAFVFIALYFGYKILESSMIFKENFLAVSILF